MNSKFNVDKDMVSKLINEGGWSYAGIEVETEQAEQEVSEDTEDKVEETEEEISEAEEEAIHCPLCESKLDESFTDEVFLHKLDALLENEGKLDESDEDFPGYEKCPICESEFPEEATDEQLRENLENIVSKLDKLED